MREKLVIVPRRKSAGDKALNIVWFGLACTLLVLAIYSPFLFAVPGIVLAVVWYIQTFQSDIEFEYTYYDGEFRFARIKAKRKRRALGEVSMEDVIAIAPRGDRSVYKYENDRSVSCRNMTSGDPDAKVYELIFKGEKGINRYEFEPDADMLDAVVAKYPRSVIR